MGNRYISPEMGFAMGINYILLTGFTVPTEITAIGNMIGFWDESNTHVWRLPPPPPFPHPPGSLLEHLVDNVIYQQLAAYIAVFLLICVATNFLGVKYYGEIEFWFACLKVAMLLGLIIFGIIANVGGINGGWYPPTPRAI